MRSSHEAALTNSSSSSASEHSRDSKPPSPPRGSHFCRLRSIVGKEGGAIEAIGHQILVEPSADGKLTPEKIQSAFHRSSLFAYQPKAKMVFISNATEVGTIYTKAELAAIASVCQDLKLLLLMDGARLGAALASPKSDISMRDVYNLTDVFWIGGTKNGALLGEAVVIKDPSFGTQFPYHMKQRGALLAKGRVLGIQFSTLLRDDLFFRLARHSDVAAADMSSCLVKLGFKLWQETESNQVFVVLPPELVQELQESFDFFIWDTLGDGSLVVRLGSGDQKFVPDVTADFLHQLAAKSPLLFELFGKISLFITSTPPYGLGYPSDITQSAYYMGSGITEHDIQMASKVLERNSIFPENTRIRKAEKGGDFEVLLASVDHTDLGRSFRLPDAKGIVTLTRGDHSSHPERVCAELFEALKYAANDRQRAFLHACIESFRTCAEGRTHVGFLEPYRDPHGIRSEFEGLVAIADDKETALLAKLVEDSARFIRRLPWATGAENDGKGPFEKNLLEPPDFSSMHALAYCSSIIFPGINLPNYNDIRQEEGFKNVIIANRMAVESQAQQYPFIDASEAQEFKRCKFPAYYSPKWRANASSGGRRCWRRNLRPWFSRRPILSSTATQSCSGSTSRRSRA
ncbi:peptidase family M49-domain-containing protein [Ilyonectria robusta]|uniref:peptidase family M49-domain-containing protein n=1 Tax=Ilyonectria robusta TaxID=1079257 RepID=UPI001E8DE335|nr:peptidase family M49-domain-containing protein [Ilyonectria robusta]KAH8729177.1 peptidase family M49-domain-containing protein [Ilyonectria robusta]